MIQHLRKMRNLIKELKIVAHVLSDEQQVQIIRSLSHSWEHMKVNLAHNKSIIAFDDMSC